MERFSIEYALLATQSALLREVTPELRAVFINMDEEQEIFYFYIYYDGEISEKRTGLWECAITEASADLGHCFIEKRVERLDYPEKITMQEYCAYLRKESSGSTKDLPKITMQEPTLGYALIAVQQTLLGEVTSELRAVIVDLEKDPVKLYIRFYHNKEISKELYQRWQSVQEKARIYFGFDCLFDAEVKRIDYPQEMPFRGRYAYLRKE
jgi:hypothetical protein